MTGTNAFETRVVLAGELARRRAAASAWPPPGCVVEIVGRGGSACTSVAVAAVVAAQRAAGVVAWVQPRHGWLFPPDLALNGVELASLVVVHVPPPHAAASRSRGAALPASHALPAAAELLLRSGAFDLLVLDFRPTAPPRGAWLARLQALARQHDSRVMVLNDASLPAYGVGIAQRVEARRRRDGGLFVVEPLVLRDKLPAADAPPALWRRAPAGLS